MKTWQITYINPDGKLGSHKYNVRNAALAIIYGRMYCEKHGLKLCSFQAHRQPRPWGKNDLPHIR